MRPLPAGVPPMPRRPPPIPPPEQPAPRPLAPPPQSREPRPPSRPPAPPPAKPLPQWQPRPPPTRRRHRLGDISWQRCGGAETSLRCPRTRCKTQQKACDKRWAGHKTWRRGRMACRCSHVPKAVFVRLRWRTPTHCFYVYFCKLRKNTVSLHTCMKTAQQPCIYIYICVWSQVEGR